MVDDQSPMAEKLVQISPTTRPSAKRTRSTSESIVQDQAANELFFAVVGHAGSGTSNVARLLHAELAGQRAGSYQVFVLKARDEIEAWAGEQGKLIERPEQATLSHTGILQDLGDEMRESGDHAAVARRLVHRISVTRANAQGREASELGPGDVVEPDGARRGYILDAVRHPDEVHLLRSVYQNAFTLIGVVCDDENERIRRLSEKYHDGGVDKARAFMQRDAKAPQKHGQRVADAFHLADVFIDNSDRREASRRDGVRSDGAKRSRARVPGVEDQLDRVVKLITHDEIVRPTVAETAMYHAHGAMMRSACLSRQVGCALMDGSGALIATGTNEAPRAGGGVYGEDFEFDAGDGPEIRDHRCARREKAYCSNTHEQNTIIKSLIDELIKAKLCPDDKRSRESLNTLLRDSRIGGLLEFSRAVHAEMDALLTAARKGCSTVGARVFVTTYPCHYCARHLVTAGVDEVQYIEPYPKSLAPKLHEDAITKQAADWTPPSRGGDKVLFRPFTGVAPRMYRRVFLKDRELKNTASGEMEIGAAAWVHAWHLGRTSYIQLESQLTRTDKE